MKILPSLLLAWSLSCNVASSSPEKIDDISSDTISDTTHILSIDKIKTLFSDANKKYAEYEDVSNFEDFKLKRVGQVTKIFNDFSLLSWDFKKYIQQASVPSHILEYERQAWLLNEFAIQYWYAFTKLMYPDETFIKISKGKLVSLKQYPIFAELFWEQVNDIKVQTYISDSDGGSGWRVNLGYPIIGNNDGDNMQIIWNELLHVMMDKMWLSLPIDIQYQETIEIWWYNARWIQFEELLSNIVMLDISHQESNFSNLELFSEDLRFAFWYKLQFEFEGVPNKITRHNYGLNRFITHDIFMDNASLKQKNYYSKMTALFFDLLKKDKQDLMKYILQEGNIDDIDRQYLASLLDKENREDYQSIVLDIIRWDINLREMIDNFFVSLSDNQKNNLVDKYTQYAQEIIQAFSERNKKHKNTY